MGHGTSIFVELTGSKRANIFNALHGFRIHVTRELLITEYSKAL